MGGRAVSGSPLVSVIMPSFNSERFIGESIRSVQDQRFSEWELIIVDDASSDGTVEIVRKLAVEDPRIRCIGFGENRGAAAARNAAIGEAKGRYIAFLDSDDLWLPWKLEDQLELMREKGCALVFGSYFRVDHGGNVCGKPVKAPEWVDYRKMLRCNYIGCLTAMYDAGVLGKVFMPEIRRRQDYGLWLRILKKTSRAYGSSRPVAIYRQTGKGSLSSSRCQNLAYNWKLYREVERLGVVRSICNMTSCCVSKILFK